MYPVMFEKARAEAILAAIENGEPIPAADHGWTIYELMQVAGACYFAAMSHGPPTADLERLGQLPLEHREATEETLYQDIHDAIEFNSHLTMQVQDGGYDEHFEPLTTAIVRRDADGEQQILPITGKRQIDRN